MEYSCFYDSNAEITGAGYCVQWTIYFVGFVFCGFFLFVFVALYCVYDTRSYIAHTNFMLVTETRITLSFGSLWIPPFGY